MSSASPYAKLFEHLTLGGLVVLPNARAARTLRSAFDQHQISLGHAAWEPARALSWQQFTTGLFSDLALTGVEPRILLNQAQEHYLWRETIAAAQPSTLASTDSLSELASSAWHLAAAWNATPRLSSTANTSDTRTFALWATDFAARCKKSGLLSLAQLDFALLKHLQAGSLAAPSNLHLAAFDDTTPSQSALLDALRAHGSQIIHHPIEHPDLTTPLRASIIAPTERDEIFLAARWLRDFLKHNPTEHRSIAVLVPSLDDDRAQIDLIFREVLAPELESIHADLSSTPWQFATGDQLASLPMLQCTLELAQWAHSALSLDRISALLLSPYLGVASDRNLAAQFDAAVLRRSTLLRPQLDLTAFIALADTKAHVAALPIWLRNFHLQLTRAGNLENTRSFADWAEFLRNLTQAANWPGERSLTAAEFEATRAWDSVLDLLSTLDFAGSRVPLAAFLESLTRQACVTTFSGPSTHAPIQVMNIEDAAGSAFDAIVFLHATDANWPRSPRPNPLLSWSLQQELNMPGASSAASTEVARRFATHLLSRADTTLFFSAAEDESGHLRPSSLLAELNLQPLPITELIDSPSITPEIILEDISDDSPLPPLPSSAVKGGARVLKLQAACAFLAFAELRLKSAELETKLPGFDALESGNFLHRTMQRFWTSVQSQENLSRMGREERDERLAACIQQSISSKINPVTDWDRAYIALQMERLYKVLRGWLDEELARSPFTVLATERDEEIEVGPLRLKVRVDRIDQVPLDDGQLGTVLVDYKTGYASDPAQWEGYRPDDPQLPLYSLITTGDLKAIAFARVRAGKEAKWAGYQSIPNILSPKKTEDLDAKVNEWRVVLTHLAEDFFSGKADVSPKDFSLNCKRCAQRLLCRLNPESLFSESDESDEDTGASDV
jgi:ATP-dependent helicase/nuclease subunit B